MKYEVLEARIKPLLDACPSRFRRRLSKFIRHPSSFSIFTALDNEVYINRPHENNSLLVISSEREEGRTTIALIFSLLSAAVDPSRKVLLVDADLENGNLAKLLGVNGFEAGLSEFFDGQDSEPNCLVPTAMTNLWLAPRACGDTGRVLLAPRKFRQFMESVEKQFDLVVLDSSAANANKDIISLASAVKSVILTIKYGHTTREQVIALLEELKRVEASVLGCVINRRQYVVPRFLYRA